MYDVDELRSRFPALRAGDTVFLDGPAGTQVPDAVIDAVKSAMATAASNQGGPFASSHTTDSVIAAARGAASDLVGGSPDEIVFGPNMTTLTFSFSRALARDWSERDRVVVTRLDHDANVTPWLMAARDVGATVDFCDIDVGAMSLDLDSMAEVIDERTRLVAVTACSNTFGSLVDVAAVAEMAHSVGALCFVDAVHLAPHMRIDVDRLGVDALVCSAYKFYGPHVGVLWARHDLLEQTEAYRVRPAPQDPPAKFETGTPSFSNLAGVVAAVDHLASLGDDQRDRRAALDQAFRATGAHERDLCARLLEGLPEGAEVWGPSATDGRVSTVAVTFDGHHPGDVAAHLAAHDIAVWAGHNYAVEPIARAGLTESGGVVRFGIVNTTTPAEIDRTLTLLSDL